MRPRLLRFAAILVCLHLLLSPCSQGQSTNAAVTGRVLDPSGAVITGADINVINTETSVPYSGKTNGDGIYLVSDIPPGTYRVEVGKPGFKTLLKPDVVLHVEAVVALNFTLPFGSVSESVTVEAGAPVVSTESGSIGSVIEGRQVTELPLNGRNFTQLALLTPGVTRGAYGDNASGGRSGTNVETFRNSETGGSALSVNGVRPQANNFLLDGLDNNESLVNTIVFFAPAEAIQEFRVATSVAPAKFGRAGGGIVETSIKSGTNQVHGSAFEFLRHSALDANDAYFGTPDPQTGVVPKLPFRRNQFGGTLGFPIIKRRLFMFLDYQGLRSSRFREPEFSTVPTGLMRQGNFSELLGTDLTTAPDPTITGCGSATAVRGAIYDPLTCAPFPGNIIPSNRINQVGLNYLNAFPLPNLSGIENNYQSQRRDYRDFDDFDARLDFAATARDLFFARFSYAQDRFTVTSLFPNLPAGFGSGYNPTHVRGGAIGYTRAFSPNLVNDLRLGYTSDLFAYAPPLGNQALAAQLGIPNANRTPQLGGGALIGGGGSELTFTGDGGPYNVHEDSPQLVDNVTWSRGRHTLRFGLNLIHRDVNFFQGNFAKGFFLMGGVENVGTGRFTGYETSELLAGFSDYEIGSGDSKFYTNNWETGYYAQDDWRVTSRLTLNLGLRYDLYTNPAEEHNRQSNFDLASGTLVVPGQAGYSRSLVNTSTNNLGPRLGFAYDAFQNGLTVIRGGYGIFYFLDRGGVGNQLSNNPDFNGNGTYQALNGYRLTLSGSAPNGSNDSSNATGPLPPAIPVVNPQDPRNASVIAVPPNNHNSMVQQWNLQVERQIDRNTALSVAYVGNKADHLMTWFNLNNQILNTPSGTSLFPGSGLIVNMGSAAGSSSYNGLQVNLNRRLSGGLQYTVAYTWSHTLDDSNGPFSVTGGGARIFVYPAAGGNLAQNRGNSDQDQRHLFTVSTLYELPFGHGKRFGRGWNPLVSGFAGGWQWNNILTLATGTPFDISVIGNPANRPDYLGNAGNGEETHVDGAVEWINYNAFATPPLNAGGVYVRPGTLARNYFHGPGTHTLDTSFFKTFDLSEELKLQLRAEAYNVLNTPQFINPDSNWSDGPSNFGLIRSTRAFSERQIQLAVRVNF